MSDKKMTPVEEQGERFSLTRLTLTFDGGRKEYPQH